MALVAPTLRTRRLLLRPWKDADRIPFAALNADPEVTAFLPGALTRSQSDAMVERNNAFIAEHGYGLWALEAPGISPFLGYVGFTRPNFDAPFGPCTEISWRLARVAWGVGYATESGSAVLSHGFQRIGLEEVVAYTSVYNERAAALFSRLGMRRNPGEDFDHPAIPAGNRLRRQMLYRLGKAEWERGVGASTS